ATTGDSLRGATAIEDAVGQKGAFQRANAADAAASETCGLTGGVETRHWFDLSIQYPRVQIREHSAHAFTADQPGADGNQRATVGVENGSRSTGAQPVPAPLAQLLNTAQLFVVVLRRAAPDAGVIALQRVLQQLRVQPIVACKVGHLFCQLPQAVSCQHIGTMVDQP